MRRAFLTISACYVLAGCGNQLTMTYNCVPSGAVLTSSGQYLGMCPLIATYPLSAEVRKAGVVNTTPLTAQWPSGASTTVQSITAKLSAGYAQQFTFVRPTGVAGAELDYQAGQNIDANAAAQQNQAAYELGNLLGRAIVD